MKIAVMKATVMKTVLVVIVLLFSSGCSTTTTHATRPTTHSMLICFSANYNGAPVTVCIDSEETKKFFKVPNGGTNDQTRVDK